MEPNVRVSPPASFTSAFDVVAIAASTGGLAAYTRLLSSIPADFPAAIVAVQHRVPDHGGLLPRLLARRCRLRVTSAEDREPLRPGTIYVAPADRQVRVGPDRTLDLTGAGRDAPGRCTADVLFESVATRFGERVIAVVLSGTMDDGAAGVRAVKRAGGRVLAQDSGTARAFGMPNAAIRTGCVDFVLPVERLASALITIVMAPGAADLFAVRTSPGAGLPEAVASPGMYAQALAARAARGLHRPGELCQGGRPR